MFRKTFFALFLLTFAALPNWAQDVPKWEIGGQYTALRLGTFDLSVPEFEEMPRGVGGRVTYNWTARFSLEGELNVFNANQDKIFTFFSGALNQRITRTNPIQGQFGAKYGLHYKRFGVFAKLRPGFLAMKVTDSRTQGPGAPTVVAIFTRRTGGYSVDAGGVLEFYPSKNTMFRIDAGNTIIRIRNEVLDSPDGKRTIGLNQIQRTNNLQLTAGFGIRF